MFLYRKILKVIKYYIQNLNFSNYSNKKNYSNLH